MEIFVLHILKLNIIAAVIILLVNLLAILLSGGSVSQVRYQRDGSILSGC